MAKPIPLVVKDLEDEFEEIEQKALGMVKEATAFIVYEVQDVPPLGTPRKTRRAVNGWNVSPDINGDFTDPGEAFLHNEPDPELEIRKLRGDENEASIANGVHYIGLLENGSSTQAPSNFVRAGIRRALSYLDFNRHEAKLTAKRGKGRK